MIATAGVPCTGATCRTPAARGPDLSDLSGTWLGHPRNGAFLMALVPGMFDDRYRVTRRFSMLKWSNGMNMEKNQQLTLVIKD